MSLGAERVVLLGGLDSSDTPMTAITVLDDGHVSGSARLPEAQHDAQGANLGGGVCVFGGGQFGSYDHVLRYEPGDGCVSLVGQLPQPAAPGQLECENGGCLAAGSGEQSFPVKGVQTMQSRNPDPKFSQSLERGLALLSCFTAQQPVLGIADLADRFDLPRSTVHRYATMFWGVESCSGVFPGIVR